jgi:ABC-2 type transport system permease protein
MLQLVALETRLLRRDMVAVVAFVLLCLAAALAVANGRALIDSQQAGRAAVAEEAQKADARFAEALAGTDDPVDALYLVFRVNRTVTAPLPPLVDASAGRAGYDSYATVVNLRARVDNLFKRTQLANPEILARGSFDLGFVAIVIAPLLLIGLGHGVFVADRDSGTARLVLAQAGGPGRLLLARSLPRLALVVLPIAAALGWLLMAGPSVPGRTTAAFVWLLVVLLYLGLWWAIILYANTLRITAETAALVLVSGWALVSLVLPALINAIAQIAYPPPSRFEQIAAARAAEIAATSAWDNDHKIPAEGDVAGAIADLQRSIAINAQIEAAAAPINNRFDARLEQQQGIVAGLSLLSPARVAADALAATAGTDSAHALAFRQSAAAYVAALKAPLVALARDGKPMTPASHAVLPACAPPPPRPLPLTALLYLGLATGAVAFLAIRRFGRIDVQ